MTNPGASFPRGLLELRVCRLPIALSLATVAAFGLAARAHAAPGTPMVIELVQVGANPEGIKFLKRGSRLFVVAANEADGTVSILEVVD